MKKQLNIPCRALAVLLAVSFANVAFAANFWWTGKDSRAYGSAGNWSSSNNGSTVATKIPGSDAVRFMAKNGSTSVFSDRFINDGYIVEFDKAYTTGYQLFFNTDSAKVIFSGTGENASLTYTRSGYSTGAVMGIGDTTDSYLRIQDMVYTHSYTNLVLGWTAANKGGLEIASDAKLVVPTDAIFHKGVFIKRGYILVDGGEIDAPNSIISIAMRDANDKAANSSVIGAFTNLNGKVTCNQLIVGAADTTNNRDNYGEYYQNGGSLATSGNIVIAQGNRARSSGKFILNGGKVTTAAKVYVGDSGLNCTTGTAYLVVNYGEIGCKELHIGKQSQGIVDINGGTVICTNECYFGWKTAYADTDAGRAQMAQDAVMHPQLNLLGGVLQTPKMYSASTNTYSTVFFNGGTLREGFDNANLIENSARLYVKVGEKGGTIDTAGVTAKLHKTIQTGVDEGTDGGMTFTGGGTLALQSSASLSYTGDTRVTSDTTFTIPTKNKVNLDKFVCIADTKPANEGHAILTITGSETFSKDDLARVRIADGNYPAASVRLKLSGDGKSILCKNHKGLIISFH